MGPRFTIKSRFPPSLRFIAPLGVFIDAQVESLVNAILGDGPSHAWAEGEEQMEPIQEATRFDAMAEFDDVPIRW